MGERPRGKEALMTWVYLNRQISIRDTTSSEMSYHKVNPERTYPALPFNFRNSKELHNFWNQLQRICLYTKLGFRRGKNQKGICYKHVNFLPSVSFTEAIENENGQIPGDGLGAAGLSSNLFAHAFRNWSWTISVRKADLKKSLLQITPVVAKKTYPKKSVKDQSITKTEEDSLLVECESSVRDQSSEFCIEMNENENKNNETATESKDQGKEKNYMLISEKPDIEIAPPTTVNSLKVKKPSKKYGPRDAIDRDALRNMRTLRVTWDKNEDRILCMAKAAALYIDAPMSLLGLLTMGKVCRDVIRQVLGHHNKTIQACVRRIQFLTRQKRHIPEVPTWLYTLQSNDFIQRNYPDGFVDTLKRLYPNRPLLVEKLTIHFILIIRKLHELLSDKIELKRSAISEEEQFKLPDSVEEFKALYRQLKPVQKEVDVVFYKNPEKVLDIQTSIIIAVLHSTLCAMRDKTLYNLQAFEIYKEYSDEALQTAFNKARKDGMVVQVKRKNLNLRQNHLTGPAYTFSARYKFRLQFLRLPYEIYDAFYEFYETFISYFYSKTDRNGVNHKSMSGDGILVPSLDMKSPNMGHMFFISEALANNILKMDIKIPSSMLTVDAEQHDVSPTDRILDHYQCLLDNAPEREYTKSMEQQENAGRQVSKVKFNSNYVE